MESRIFDHIVSCFLGRFAYIVIFRYLCVPPGYYVWPGQCIVFLANVVVWLAAPRASSAAPQK